MKIAWGKNKLTLTPLGVLNATAIEFTNIADGTTQLTTEKGDKQEALIEGGEAEAVKYKKSKYSVEWQYRLGSNRNWPLDGTDGVIDGEYKLEVENVEDTEAPGFELARVVVSYEDSYTTEEGIIRTYLAESLSPSSGTQITWNNVTTS